VNAGRGWLTIGHDFLVKLIGLPEGTGIMRADMNSWGYDLRLGLQGPQLPLVPDGAIVPDVTASWRIEREGPIERVFGSYGHNSESEWLAYERLVPNTSIDDLADYVEQKRAAQRDCTNSASPPSQAGLVP
jgi:hypothetical protein